MDRNDYLLQLTSETLNNLENNQVPLSTSIRRSIRIARLRNDFDNLLWLEWEMCNLTKEDQRNPVIAEVLPHYTSEGYKLLASKYYLEWANEREIVQVTVKLEKKDGKILAKSVPEIENDLNSYARLELESKPPNGLHPVDLYFVDQSKTQIRIMASEMAKNCSSVLEKIKQRTHRFLSNVEKQLMFGQVHSDIFEKNRQYVELKLGEICPDVMGKFLATYRRLQESDPEAGAQAITSCRRLLKSLADALYPAKQEPITCFDGKERILTEEKYISRLWQFIFEKTQKNTSGELLVAQLQDLGNRIDKIYDLANKGVHAEVSDFEVNQCIIQTYLLLGDILRISERTSAITIEQHINSAYIV